MTALYTILTHDPEQDRYSPQEGLTVPSERVPWTGLLAVLRQLRCMGYMAHYSSKTGMNDPMVLVERVDAEYLRQRDEELRRELEAWKALEGTK